MPKLHKINTTALVVGLIGFFLAFKSVADLDFWWHLSTGRWIIENHQFVHSDFLSYTFKDSPWMDLTWGFEVIQYLLYSMTGNYWLVSCFFGFLGFFTAYITFLTFELFFEEGNSTLSFLGFILCIVGIFFVDFRWIHRPEQFTHLYGVILIYLLIRNQKETTKLIWWIPVVQIFWVNTHGMFLVGPVITGVFLFQRVLDKGVSKVFEKLLSEPLLKVLGVQLAVCLLNSRGWDGAIFPIQLWEVLNHSFYRNTIPEGTNPYKDGVWGTDTWALTVYVLLFVFSFIYPFNKEVSKNKVKFYGIGYILFSLMLFRLSVIARRNIALFILWTLPIVVFELSKRIKEGVTYLQNTDFQEKIPVYTKAIGIFVCLGLFSNFLRSEASNIRFGGEIANFEFPVGSIEKLKTLKTLPRFFAGVQFSDFMDFHLKGYASYIDGRFAEVYPIAHFQRYMDILAHPRLIDAEVEKWKIEAMGLETRNPMMQSLIRYISQSPNWKLFYLDETAVIFLKSGDGERNFNNAQIAEGEGRARIESIKSKHSDWNPFNFRSSADKALGLTRLSETLLLLEANIIADEALVDALKIEREFPAAVSMQCVTSFSLLEQRVGLIGNNSEKLAGLLSSEAPLVEEKCRKAKKRGADKTSALFTSALLHLNLGKYEDSAREFSEVVKKDPLGPQGHLLLGRSYAALGNAFAAEASYLEAARLRPMEGQPLLELANVFEQMGQKEKAKAYKEEASHRMQMQSMNH